MRQNELNALRKQIEREYQEKVRLEDEILEKLRSQLTLDKASQYTDKIAHQIRTRTKELVRLLALGSVPRDIFETIRKRIACF